MKLLPRILAEEDELDRAGTESESLPEPTAEPEARRISPRWIGVVALAALLPRLGYLFLFSDPENTGDPFTDAYHHWQIAYLTKEIGLSHGPRLWDMRGWEYFWGLLHPLLMNVLFFATGSTDIVLARLLSLAFGSMAVVLIFLLCNRYWGLSVAIAAGAFAAFSPAAIFNDVAGMAEPIAMALILLGIWLTPKRGFWGGVAWALSAMARVEAWFFGAGLVVAWLAGARRSSQSRAPLVIGWALGMGLYAKFLSDQTGNPIYPLYWNFQFVGLGAGGTGATAAHPLVFSGSRWAPPCSVVRRAWPGRSGSSRRRTCSSRLDSATRRSAWPRISGTPRSGKSAGSSFPSTLQPSWPRFSCSTCSQAGGREFAR